MRRSVLELKWFPRWKARPLPFAVAGLVIVLCGGLLSWAVSIGPGLGLASLGLAFGLGGWALVSQWRSERFDFLEASQDLYTLREPLSDPAEGTRRIEWITWGSTKVCERADLASRSAEPSERRKFLRDLSHLIDFANSIIVSQDRRGFRRFDQLLRACEEVNDWPEAEGPPGDEVIQALSVHLGEPAEETGFADYVAKRREVMEAIHDANRENEEFDPELFRSLLDGDLEETPEPREFGMKVLTPENWHVPDAIHESFFGSQSPEDLRARHTGFVKQLLDLELHDQVPNEVRRLYRTARGTMVYGFFYYPLYNLASEQLHRVIDAALGHKCEELEAPEGLDVFHRRLNWLMAEGVLREEDRRQWEATRHLRNSGSHPEDRTLIPPGQAFLSLRLAAKAINQLFDPDTSTVEFPKPPRRDPEEAVPRESEAP